MAGTLPGDRSILRVLPPRFETMTLGQSNPFPGASNTLTLTIASNVQLTSRAAITLSGISGATATSGVVSISDGPGGTGHSGLVSASIARTTTAEAQWDNILKNITLFVSGGGMTVSTSYVISFSVTNPTIAHLAPSISIEATAAVMQVDVVNQGTGYIAGEVYAVSGNGYPWARWCGGECGGSGFAATFSVLAGGAVDAGSVSNEGFAFSSQVCFYILPRQKPCLNTSCFC